MHRYRSHNCGELRRADIGRPARLSGWVHRIRDHGGLLFIDLRDHYGLVQAVVDPDSPVFTEVEKVRAEWVIKIDGDVRERSADRVNKHLPTGEIELYIEEIEVLGEADELPLPVFAEPHYPEETRLRYRYLDLRREHMHKNIMLRSEVVASIRKRMHDHGFTEFQTPILTASSPEGARDFLVPSRLHRGKFYALPQAPQQFKQMVMIAGFDRYFQVAPCFRDEDPRADRSPGEFYQLDIEMSFVTQEDVFATVEPIMLGLFSEFANGRKVEKTVQRIAYHDAMLKYGTDKPDLRNPIEIQLASEHFRNSGFKIFSEMLANDASAEIRAIPAPGGGSRAFCDRMNSWAQKQGQAGLGYIFWREEEGKIRGAGPIARNLGEERTEAIRQQLNLAVGDAAFFCAGRPTSIEEFSGDARSRIGDELDLIDRNSFIFCWIVDFPMYEWDQENERIDFSHNPFSMPQGGEEALASADPLTILGYQYDLVCNGVELSSGAIRNHCPEMMLRVFEIAGYDADSVEKEFSGMFNALKYGAPPHGGIAPGIDRIMMLLADAENIREVVMFPMNQQAEDLMIDAPATASSRQLSELGIRIIEEK